MQAQPHLNPLLLLGKKHPALFNCFFPAILSLYMLTGCDKKIEQVSAISETVGQEVSVSGTARPNIIFILADDLGYEVPACNGGTSVSTPNLDMMAANGIRFTQAHSTPLCSPSRVMLLTGKYNNRNYTEWGRLSTDQRTIANMLKDSGYTTCFAGKWQLDGGDASIRTFGWDKYSVWLPFDIEYEFLEGSRFKGAKIYEDGAYLPPSETDEVYADDRFSDYIKQFIDTATANQQPFFAFYSMNLVHPPMSPTPDDPEYATWNFLPRNGSRAFFPSMVKYMDKKIGEIIAHVNAAGIQNNTIIIFSADNGTSANIKTIYDGIVVSGGKGETDEPGTNVPLLALWPGTIPGGTVSDRLIDFSDVLPTMADIAGIPKPSDYGIIDGISFYGDLTGTGPINQRSWIYCAYNSDPLNPGKTWIRWVQNDTYKLYDSGRYEQAGKFIRLEKGKPDGAPIPINELTPEQKLIAREFARVLIRNR